MSGPFGSSQWMYSSGGGFYPYEIEQSLRFNDDDSAYLSWTPASAGNRKTWTWSGWVKRCALHAVNSAQPLFSCGSNASNFNEIRFSNTLGSVTDTLNFTFVTGGADTSRVSASNIFRDTSAWYHVVVALDTTEATAANRVRIYINGAEVSYSETSYPALNSDWFINNNLAHNLGRNPVATSRKFDGYLAEVNFIDGLALDPTSFGEFKSDIWVPKTYTGSYGTNGFYLSFSDSAAIGDDLSGNTNDWTANNLVASDVMLDSPTNNYCVWSAIDKDGDVTLSEGNMRATGATAAANNVFGSFAIPTSGKWYFEICNIGISQGYPVFGIAGVGSSLSDYSPTYGAAIRPFGGDGNKPYTVIDGSDTVDKINDTALSSGEILQFIIDADNGDMWFGIDNTYYGLSGGSTVTVSASDITNGVNPAYTLTSGIEYTPYVSVHSSSTALANFGQDSSFAGNKTAQGNTDDNGQGDFYYTPPSGFLALNTANLPAPAIDPAEDDVPADYFNTVLYTGTGAALSVTGVGFQPDWTWIKGRSGATDHALYDAVRGVQEQLESNQTSAETTEATGLTAFGADGFSVGALAQLNTSTATYVAWNWLAGNGTASNTDGTITSTVSVNQKAGFSIVSYTGTGANATVGHGLGAAPSMVIVKNRDQADAWQVYHGANTANPETDYLVLNTTAATADAADRWNDTLPTSSVFSLGNGATVNTSSEDYIAYCFAEVEGFSKFGSYTGNGSADGPFVYCGFRPAFVMVKRTDSTGNWVIEDAAREPYNDGLRNSLYADLSNAEDNDAFPTDFLSNGFKHRNSGTAVNTSGGTYIFAAFAESPFKYSNAR